MFCLRTGVLWPVAAVFSSILTAYLNKQSKDNCYQVVSCEDRVHIDHSKDAMGDEYVLASTDVPHSTASSEATTHMANFATISISEDVTSGNTHAPSCEVVRHIAAGLNTSLTPTSPDRMDIFLTRSEGEDWGFAWQVSAYAARRLIIVNVRVSSPMESCNASRQADGLPTIDVGDELVCAGSHSDFHALQEVLASATSVQLTFLRAHAVSAIANSGGKKAKRLSNAIVFKTPSVEKLPKTSKEGREATKQANCTDWPVHEVSKAIIGQAIPSAASFEMVVKTKNTFIDFQMADNDRMDRKAQSDPTSMRTMRPILSHMMDSVEDVVKLPTDSVPDKEESSSSLLFCRHAGTVDINDLAMNDTKCDMQEHQALSVEVVYDSVNASLGIDEHQTAATEFPHFDTMYLRDFFIDELNPCKDGIKKAQISSSELVQDAVKDNFGIDEHRTMHFDYGSIDPCDFDSKGCMASSLEFVDDIYEDKSETGDNLNHDNMELFKTVCNRSKDVVNERQAVSELQIAQAKQEMETPHLDPTCTFDSLIQSQGKGIKNLISLEHLLSGEPLRVETSLCEPSCGLMMDGMQGTGLLSSSGMPFNCANIGTTRPYANSLIEGPPVMQHNGSEVLGTRPCLAPSWDVRSNGTSRIRQEQIPRNCGTPSRQEPYLKCYAPGLGKVCLIQSGNPCELAVTNTSDSDEGACTTISFSEHYSAPRAGTTGLPGPKEDFMKISDDWYCPTCFDLQFRANERCRMCGLPREDGVTDLRDLDADKFLQGHCVTAYAEAQFRTLTPDLQQTVMSGGSLHGARDPTAVLSKRMKKAEALARRNGTWSQVAAPIKLGFDRKRTTWRRHLPAGSEVLGTMGS